MNNHSKIESEKLVSIGLVTYNSEERIKRAIDSLLSQTYRNFELIISDDASSDKTSEVCLDYAKEDSRIRYIRQSKNLGRRENFRFVVKVAQGEYVMWAADDDWWDPRYIELLVHALEKNKKYSLAMSSIHRIYRPENSIMEKLILTGKVSTNHQTHVEIYKRIVNDELVHLFANGIWRKEFFAKLLSRPLADTVKWDRIIMAEAALGTLFYSVEPVLFLKTKRRTSIKVRHKEDPERKLHKRYFRYSRYALTMLRYLMTSPVISLKRKTIIPFLWFSFALSNRKRIFWVAIRDSKSIIKGKLHRPS